MQQQHASHAQGAHACRRRTDILQPMEPHKHQRPRIHIKGPGRQGTDHPDEQRYHIQPHGHGIIAHGGGHAVQRHPDPGQIPGKEGHPQEKLYGGRQHRRVSRESLDCAYALQQLRAMGVKNIITFDAHDPRVMNAVPLMSFDNVMPTYQVLKCLLHHVPDVDFSKEQFLVVSPDEGAMNRNMYYSSVLGCNLGMFYKRRDYSRVVNGRNPIVAHEYLGEDVKGKDVFIADDIIASGESMLDIGYELKMRGAKNIFTCATFPLFTAGLDKFDKAYNDGIIKAVLGTNLTYRKPELLERPWYFDVDLSKYTAYFIAAINHDMSVSSIIDPMTKIKHLLDNHGIPIGNQE